MEKQLFKDETPEGRKTLLRDNCQSAEILDYERKLSPAELTDKKDRLAVISIEEKDILEEKKQAMDKFKDRLDPIQEEKSVLLTHIKDKKIPCSGECFKFIEGGKAWFYNSEGELVYTRAARAEEYQMKAKLV